jgi:signal transduction histidine kinase
VTYVVLVCALATVVGVLSWRPITDPATLVFGCAGVIAMSALSVRTISGVNAVWSASVCVHLGMTLALGPAGAIAAALSHSVIGHSLVRSGSFRVAFNSALYTLTNLSAWWAVQTVVSSVTTANAPLAGLVVGGSAWATDHILISGVVALATEGRVRFASSLRSGLGVLPHTLAYGWAAAGITLLYRQAGVAGFSMLLVPVFSAQVFLVLLARRTQRHQQELRLAEEAERRRIARDLHDTVVQTVAGTAMILAAESDGQGEVPVNQWRRVMTESASDLRGAASELRTLILQLAPPTLKQDGLAAALQPLIRSLVESGSAVEVSVPSDLRVPDDDLELLFRVAQEALRNVAAHAHAEHVRVSVRQRADATELRVDDDGTGFTPDDVNRRRREGHVGTRGIAEVAAQRGATLTIASAPGEGTHVVLAVPVRAAD